MYDGIMIVGKLLDIDIYRNIHLSHVTMIRPLQSSIAFARLCIRFVNVRYVRIPDQIDVLETIRRDLQQMNPKPKGKRGTEG